MTLHTCTRGLLAGAATVIALTAGIGMAHAAPDPAPPPPPPVIDEWSQYPTTWVIPSNEGQPITDSGDSGMICQNLLVRCQ